jgi:hypothetical protein
LPISRYACCSTTRLSGRSIFAILAGELYGPLLDLKLFNQVRLDQEVYTLVWPNDADFDPATLHNW